MYFNEILTVLLAELPVIAKRIIERRSENERFLANPDNPEEHDPFGHHQYGIITHTRKFLEAYQSEMAMLLSERRGLLAEIRKMLSVMIDDMRKGDLIQLGIVLHDVGKFARGFKIKESMNVPDYKNHEAKSERIIRNDHLVQSLLQERFRLTSNQIDYIARCAGFHFELGKIRNEAKESSMGYSFAFVASGQFEEICKKIARESEEFKVEVGILFLGDSLAKTDVCIQATSDAEIDQQIPMIEKNISERGLNKKLIVSARQRPVNIAVARKYLEIILGKEG